MKKQIYCWKTPSGKSFCYKLSCWETSVFFRTLLSWEEQDFWKEGIGFGRLFHAGSVPLWKLCSSQTLPEYSFRKAKVKVVNSVLKSFLLALKPCLASAAARIQTPPWRNASLVVLKLKTAPEPEKAEKWLWIHPEWNFPDQTTGETSAFESRSLRFSFLLWSNKISKVTLQQTGETQAGLRW